MVFFPCSGIDDSARDESGDVPSKMAKNTEYHDRSPCLETLFVDDKPFNLAQIILL